MGPAVLGWASGGSELKPPGRAGPAATDAIRVSRAYDWAEYIEERVDMMRRWADLTDWVAGPMAWLP